MKQEIYLAVIERLLRLMPLEMLIPLFQKERTLYTPKEPCNDLIDYSEWLQEIWRANTLFLSNKKKISLTEAVQTLLQKKPLVYQELLEKIQEKYYF